MRRKILRAIIATNFVLVMMLASWPAQAEAAKASYPAMAPLEQYLMPNRDAEVLVLGRTGYETAVKGKNGFVCIVQRSWTAGIDDPDFWNPKPRAPICFNPSAARTYLPLIIKKTNLILAGQSKAKMVENMKAALDKKELPALEPGAMCYMLSKEGYLSDRGGHWHPHLMFFVPATDSATWGADLPGSPILAAADPLDRLTIFMVPVAKWSDGTADSSDSP
jgi:hypothetical protein